jgi:hypothetical protein
VACSSSKDGIAAVPAAIPTAVDGQRIMTTAATSTITANTGIVRRIMASLRFPAPEWVFGRADMVQAKLDAAFAGTDARASRCLPRRQPMMIVAQQHPERPQHRRLSPRRRGKLQ